MLFSSVPFLYYFLPAVILCYFLVPKGLKNTVLLVFSLAFYAWGEPKYVLLMLATIALFYICGLAIGKANTQSLKKLWLLVSVVVGVGLLAVFNFALEDTHCRCMVGDEVAECREIFNTDRRHFGGEGRISEGYLHMVENGVLPLSIPAMTAIFFRVFFRE